jgi:hypothetical protein
MKREILRGKRELLSRLFRHSNRRNEEERMKRKMIAILTATLLMLTGCGGGQQAETANVDLESFYSSLQSEYGWSDTYLVDIEGEMLEGYYPGLTEIGLKQMVAKMPQMSAVVNELVFLECETEEDASKAVGILQDRINTQADGGAWYPESMEAWGRGIVLQQGNYVAMIASAEHQDELVEKFNASFT